MDTRILRSLATCALIAHVQDTGLDYNGDSDDADEIAATLAGTVEGEHGPLMIGFNMALDLAAAISQNLAVSPDVTSIVERARRDLLRSRQEAA